MVRISLMFNVDCVVYVGCKMSGRDKLEQVKRAEYVSKVLEENGLIAISPVVEEEVKPEEGKLVNHDKDRLKEFWKRDKEIIVKEAHVVLLDHGEMKSFGMEREMGLNRYCLWKPTIMLGTNGTPLSVAQFEDDMVFYSVHHAAQEINRLWGTRFDRWLWRLRMLNRTLPMWMYRQILAWR